MRGKRVSDDLFRVICITFDETKNLRATARALHMPTTSVWNALKRRVGTTYLQRNARLGRPRLFIPRSFLQYVKRHGFNTWTQFSYHHFLISRWSVKRACARLGYRFHAAIIDRLTDEQKRTRLQWVARHWQTDFSRWLFSNEAFFELADCSVPRRARVIRSAGEKYCSACVLKNAPKNRHGVMIWGCISSGDLSAFCTLGGAITATVYTRVLEEHPLGLVDELPLAERDNYTFQQDNARVHTGLEAQAFFMLTGVHLADWPPYSPDLSPIENIWRLLKREVRKRRPTTMQELRAAIAECWREIVTPERCAALFATMQRKMTDVENKRGML